MNGVAEIQERVRASQPCAQIVFANAQATHPAQFVCITRLWLIKQTVILSESVASKVRFETADRSSVRVLISGSGKNFQPDRVDLLSFQANHPLQRDGEYSSTLTIFRCKSTHLTYSH